MKITTRIITILILLLISMISVNAESLQSGLVAWYSMDDLTDSSGQQSNLVLNGDIVSNTTDCQVGNCYTFDGDSDYFDTGKIFEYDDFTICGWYSVNDVGATVKTIWGNSEGFPGEYTYVLAYQTTFYGEVSDASTKKSVTGTVSAKTWEQFCYRVWSNGTHTLLRDNTHISEGTDHALPYDTTPSGNDMIGVKDVLTNAWSGELDEIVYWNRTLNLSEMSSYWNAGNGITYSDLNLSTGNNAPVIDWNNHEPINDTSISISSYEFNFNCSDSDNDTLSFHISTEGTPTNSTYDNIEGLNTSLTTIGMSEGYNNITLICDDGTENITSEKYIFVDTIEPFIWFINPSVNGTNFETDFNYHINISDTNLYSSNVTTHNSTGDIQYTNYTEDYNITDVVLIDTQEVVSFIGGTYDLCIEVCDAHTSNKLSDEFSYIIDGNKLEIKDSPITFNGNIKELKVTQTDEKLLIQLDLNQVSEYSITLDQCFKKVSSTDYYGHYVCHEKLLWFDTNPFQVSYIIKDQYGRHQLFMNPTEKEINFDSVGEINCKNECIQYDSDADEPEVFLTLPIDDSSTQNETLGFQFNYSHPPPSDKVLNCSLEIDGIQNESILGSPFLLQNTMYEIEVENLFDVLANRTIDWTINCTDQNNHISHNANIWQISYETNITGIIPSNTTTAEAIESFVEFSYFALFMLLWGALLIISIVFWRVGLFAIIFLVFSLGLGLAFDFNDNMILRIVFIVFSISFVLLKILMYSLSDDSGK